MAKYIPLLLMMALASTHAADSTRPAANAINALGLDLLKVSAKPWENTLLSPYSIQSALAMTYAGAEGETREQMARVLHFPKSDVHGSFNALQKELARANGEEIALVVANRLFGQAGYDFRPAFLDLVKDKYDAPLEQLDFRKNAASATRTINAWVEKQTRDRIRNLIPSTLSPDSRLVLVNAIYMKAPWADDFNEHATQPQPFHLPGGKTTDVPTMVQKTSYGYAKKDAYTAVTLPYAAGDLQFLILLPDSPDGLSDLEKKLTPELLIASAALKPQKILLYLPKFKLQPPLFQLSNALEGLGMKSAFDIPKGSANFNGIAPRTPADYLYISEVFHKTFIDVDENGTEAAAATAVAMLAGAAMPAKEPDPVIVRVDRPFLFAIQHRPSGACLFLGRMVNPKG